MNRRCMNSNQNPDLTFSYLFLYLSHLISLSVGLARTSKMSNPRAEAAKEIELQELERQLKRRQLEFDVEKHEITLAHSKNKLENHELRIELQNQELRIQHDRAELEKEEFKLKEKIKGLQEIETGPNIIRLEISKKFTRGMEGSLEHEIRQIGDINALQRCRFELYIYEQDLDGKEDRLAEFLDVETRLREIAQREMRWEYYQLSGARVEQELSESNKEYKRVEREWWTIRDSFSDGPLTRAFELWRGNPKWYMHRVLREDCARRGGCCGRECGCCLDRKFIGDRRKHANGHCTVECGCCQKAGSFEISENKKNEFSIRYAVSQDGKKSHDFTDIRLKTLEMQNQHLQQQLSEEAMKDTVMGNEISDGIVAEYKRCINEDTLTDDEAEFTDESDDGCPPEEEEDPHYRRISLASIWGLVDGNFENPFDLIDEEMIYAPWQLVGRSEWPNQDENDSTMTETDW